MMYLDSELLAGARAGDMAAYGALYDRYRHAALRAARRLTPDRSAAEDAVSEAFTAILRAIRSGHGPTDVFSGYLLSSVKRAVHRLYLKTSLEQPTESDWILDRRFTESALEAEAPSLILEAFESLPHRWKMVIWQLDVEEFKVREVAIMLTLSSNATVALHRRALAGLRFAYLSRALHDTTSKAACATATDVPALIAGSVAAKRREQITAHVVQCQSCSRLLVEATQSLRTLSSHTRRWVQSRRPAMCA